MENNIPVCLNFLNPNWVHTVLELCDRNDKAHQRDHIFTVLKEAQAILQDNPELDKHWRFHVLTAVLVHDSCCWMDRKNHHVLGAGFFLEAFEQEEVFNDYFAPAFLKAGALVIAQAVLEHRASWTGTRISPVSQAVAAADRGIPNYTKYLRRAVEYRIGRLKEGTVMTTVLRDQIIEESLNHVLDKFGSEGYAWKNYPFEYYRYKNEVKGIITVIESKAGRDQLRDYAKLEFDTWL